MSFVAWQNFPGSFLMINRKMNIYQIAMCRPHLQIPKCVDWGHTDTKQIFLIAPAQTVHSLEELVVGARNGFGVFLYSNQLAGL